jgi:hypothetical protein
MFATALQIFLCLFILLIIQRIFYSIKENPEFWGGRFQIHVSYY